MNQTAIEAKRAYMRRWRAANPEKVKAHQEKYWERKAAKMEEMEGKNNAAAGFVNTEANCAEIKG